MELDIKGRIALVLAAGGGLGRAIALALAREGARVAACDLNSDSLEATLRHAGQENLDLNTYRFDLGAPEQVETAVTDIEQQLGPVDILVNITGGPPPGSLVGIPTENWHRHFATMVTPVIQITDRVLPQMRSTGWGRIVTSTSSGVIAPIPDLGLSNTLRSALTAWSKTLAGEIGEVGITANIVVPGRIATARIRALDQARAQRDGQTIDQVERESTATIPLHRYGTPDEYADVVTFLCSNRASFINGSVIRIDGGQIPST